MHCGPTTGPRTIADRLLLGDEQGPESSLRRDRRVCQAFTYSQTEKPRSMPQGESQRKPGRSLMCSYEQFLSIAMRLPSLLPFRRHLAESGADRVRNLADDIRYQRGWTHPRLPVSQRRGAI